MEASLDAFLYVCKFTLDNIMSRCFPTSMKVSSAFIRSDRWMARFLAILNGRAYRK